ncbi:glycosyltransferase [Jiangella anatolica]|uniref:glycosyltransferase n=1 Tax=Jiangella anatolica TaxID=2670374 RepID=UPI001314C577|nr:glycosyltransferase [Jiangella anatolica]
MTAIDNGSTTPSVYSDPGIGADAALDAFASDIGEPEPVDPTALLTHDVTAVIVAHDGNRFVHRTLEAVAALRRMPERIVAVDTGSRDETEQILTSTLGAPSVVSMSRSTGFGAAVAAGVAAGDEMAQAMRGTGGLRRSDQTHWVWVLHDDSAPAPDALSRLLEAAVRRPDAGIIGPKVLDWREGRQLLEIGLTVTGGGRRHTGLDRREYDQGQHDTTKNVLAVGSAGMLIRRDVWDELGGFDPNLTIFRDDLDLGWRANEAGYPVVVCPEAIVYHAEAAAHGRRRLGATRDRPHLADRRNAIYVLLANTPARSLLFVLLRVLFMSLGRSLTFLVGKQPALAFEELVALLSVIGRPDRLIRARAFRRRTRRKSPSQLRTLFPPRGQQLRHAGENVLGMITGSGGGAGHDVSGGRRAASSGDEEEAPAGDDGWVLRFLLHPAVLMTAALIVIVLVTARGLIGSGRLFGGALLPSPAAAGELWAVYTESWHGAGLGSASASPPYLGAVAVVATIVRNASLAVDLLLLGSVPLAGLTMYLLVRRVVTTKLLRVWVAASYALLPATTGAIAAGRLGTAVAAVLTPLLVLAVMRTLGSPGRPGPGRAAWSAGLLLAVVSAFVPLAWLIALVLAIVAAATVFGDRRSLLRLGVLLAVAPVVLIPWTGSLISRPMLLVTEAGVPGPDLSDPELAPWSVLLQNPGGPGSGPLWLGAGIVVAAWFSLFRPVRRLAIASAWTVVGVALVAGIVLSRIAVSGPTLETPVAGWPGFATVVVAGGLLVATAIGAEGARERLSRASFGWRQPLAVIVAAAAGLAPIVAAGWWVARGAGDPIERRDPQILPAYVADEAAGPQGVRTLVLNRADDGRITYALLRESGPRLGDAETSPPPEEYGPLDDVVADVVSGRGGADGARLAEFAVRYVYLPRPFDPDLADTLDTVPGLVRSSAPEGAAIWQIDQPVARVWVAAPPAEDGELAPLADENAEVVTVPSDESSAAGSVPEGPEGRLVVLSELADSGWTARLNGAELTPTTYGGWAQAFELPPQAGQLTVEYEGNRRAFWLWFQLGAVVVALVLALPGIRRDRGAVDDAADLDPDDSSPQLPLEPVPAREPAAARGGRRRGSRRGAEPSPSPRPEPTPVPVPEPAREPEPATVAEAAWLPGERPLGERLRRDPAPADVRKRTTRKRPAREPEPAAETGILEPVAEPAPRGRKRAAAEPPIAGPPIAGPLTDPASAEPAPAPRGTAEPSPHDVGDWNPFARAGVDDDAPRGSLTDAYKGRRAGRQADEAAGEAPSEETGRGRRTPGKRAAGKRAKGRRQEDEQ